jgi:hypothetical protein
VELIIAMLSFMNKLYLALLIKLSFA